MIYLSSLLSNFLVLVVFLKLICLFSSLSSVWMLYNCLYRYTSLSLCLFYLMHVSYHRSISEIDVPKSSKRKKRSQELAGIYTLNRLLLITYTSRSPGANPSWTLLLGEWDIHSALLCGISITVECCRALLWFMMVQRKGCSPRAPEISLSEHN